MFAYNKPNLEFVPDFFFLLKNCNLAVPTERKQTLAIVKNIQELAYVDCFDIEEGTLKCLRAIIKAIPPSVKVHVSVLDLVYAFWKKIAVRNRFRDSFVRQGHPFSSRTQLLCTNWNTFTEQ